MKKELKDYLHLYLGCECKTPFGVLRLSHFDLKGRYKAWFNDGYKENSKVLLAKGLKGRSFELSEIKPILRPLSDITEEESVDCWRSTSRLENELLEGWQVVDYYRKDTCFYEAPEFHFLLSHHFDLFGLIESGLAISKPTPNK